ncbi:hypothetical protein DY000_02056029 [Brassica cretica]|uniref:Uncharacterized protein n=1 Tax=Brassica cretica TaxID=69181 RepID=A0ABQ7AA05_BRACR|nr:hypothetical protein DY000_02056029 [Brassica cretica]
MNESTHDERCGAESGRIENQKVSDTIVESFKLVTEEMKRERRVCYEATEDYEFDGKTSLILHLDIIVKILNHLCSLCSKFRPHIAACVAEALMYN